MDRDSARAILDKFSEAARKRYPDSNGYAYLSGYYQSAIVELLEQLKPNQCMSELMTFEREAKRLERETVEAALKEQL
jgi:hypothetical protein